MSEWQPIETAPKGVNILMLSDEGVYQAKWNGDFFEPIMLCWHGCGCCGGGSHKPKPTHWMPLPEPPK